MKKFILILSILFFSTMSVYADSLGSGLPGYSSSPLGSSGFSNSNTYRGNVYDSNTSVARPNLDTPRQSIPNSVYQNNGSLLPVDTLYEQKSIMNTRNRY